MSHAKIKGWWYGPKPVPPTFDIMTSSVPANRHRFQLSTSVVERNNHADSPIYMAYVGPVGISMVTRPTSNCRIYN